MKFLSLLFTALIMTVGCTSQQNCPPGKSYMSNEDVLYIIRFSELASKQILQDAQRCDSPLAPRLTDLSVIFAKMEQKFIDTRQFDDDEFMKRTSELADHNRTLKGCGTATKTT